MKDIVMAHSGSLHFKRRQGKNQRKGIWDLIKNHLSSTENVVQWHWPICLWVTEFAFTVIKTPQPTNKPTNTKLGSAQLLSACQMQPLLAVQPLSTKSRVFLPLQAQAPLLWALGHTAWHEGKAPGVFPTPCRGFWQQHQDGCRVQQRKQGVFRAYKEFNPLFSQNTKNSSFRKGTKWI